MKSIKVKKNHLLLFILVFTPLILMFQGLDVTDTGWMLTYFQNIFSEPESVSFWFHLWGTHVIGGVWNLFFKSFGLLGFRFAGVLIFWLTCFFIYKTYEGLIPKDVILAGLCLGLTFHFAGKISIIHYNNLSMLFFAAVFFSFRKGLKNNNWAIFFTALLLTLNGFVRLPNIIGLVMGFIFLVSKIQQKEKWSLIVKSSLWYISGIIAGIVFVFGIMHILGHTEIYLSSLKSLFSSSGDDYSHYGSSTIVKRFRADFVRCIYWFFISCLFFFPVSKILISIKKRHIRWYSFMFLIVCLFFLIISRNLVNQTKLVYFVIIGCIFLTSIPVILLKECTSGNFRLVALVSILIIIILSLGSDTGMKVGTYGIIAAFPFFLNYWLQSDDKTYRLEIVRGEKREKIEYKIQISGQVKREFLKIFLVFYVIFSISALWYDVYRDSDRRFSMVYSVDSQLLKGILTTKRRAVVLDDLLKNLKKYVKPGDDILCFESIGMVHYLTETRPYLSNPWPLQELPSNLEKLFQERKSCPLPVVVQAIKQTRNSSWPDSGVLSQKTVDIQNRSIYRTFLEDNNYISIWSNEMFRILLPKKE